MKFVISETGWTTPIARLPVLGIRAANAAGAFLPTDVQANLTSPACGFFFNSEYCQFRIHIRFER